MSLMLYVLVVLVHSLGRAAIQPFFRPLFVILFFLSIRGQTAKWTDLQVQKQCKAP